MKTLKTKVFLFALAIASFSMLLTACSKKEKAETPYKVEFEKEQYAVPFEGEVKVRVIADRTASKDVTVNYSIAGTIEDYEVGAQSFVIKQGEKTAEIIVNVDTDKIKEGEKLTLTLTDSGPLVLFAGVKSTDILVLEEGALIYTFDRENYTMTETVLVTLTLSSPAGTYTAQSDLHIPIALSATSTAVEGTHFEFAGAKEIVIPAGKSKGTIELKLPEEEEDFEQEAGKDLIVLELAGGNPLLKPGNYDLANIVIFGSLYNQLVGSWTYKALTNKDWWELNYNWSGDDLSKLPLGALTDKITFDEGGIKIAMTSDLKNYFREGPISYIKEEIERIQELPGFPAETIVVVNALANVAFSKTKVDERQAEIGFRVFRDAGKDILEITVRDFEPVDFLQNSYGFALDWGYDPIMKGSPLRYHFEKVSK